MEKPGFLSLPDEVLVHIFSFLDGIDKIHTCHTCVRFSNVVCDRKLSRKLKLTRSYSVTMEDIKRYLKPKIMRQNLRVLDITNCYWLQPSEVYATVLNLKNLVAFYSVGVMFTYNHIVQMLTVFSKLKYLSFSWPEQTPRKQIKKECLDSIMFLYLYFPKVASIDWFHLYSWICGCKNLKQLWLISAPYSEAHGSLLTQQIQSPFLLDTLVIVGFQNEFILQQLRSVCRMSTETCKCLWVPTDCTVWKKYFTVKECEVDCPHFDTSWGTCLESLACRDQRITLGENGKLKRLYWNICKPPFCAGDEKFEDLEELETRYCFPLILLQPLHMLTVLCIPTNCFLGPRGEQKEEVRLLPKWCPEIQHLELGLCTKCKDRSRENSFLLEMIAEWPKLKTLKLSDCWNLRSGKAFDKIFKCCKNLEKLFLKNLGAVCGYVFELAKALKQCNNLKDFRLEETYVPPVQIRQLLEALTECPLIERVALVLQNGDEIPADALVFNLIEKSPKLIFLSIITSSMVEAQRKRLMKTITQRFKTTRPALRCCFKKCLNILEMDKLPAVHLYEMLYPDFSGPLEMPHKKSSLFEVPYLDAAAIEGKM